MDQNKKPASRSQRSRGTDADAAPGRTSATQTLAPVQQRATGAPRPGSTADLVDQPTGRAHGLVPFEPADIQSTAMHGVREGGGALPFLDQIQGGFGRHDISGIMAHIGGAASEASEAMGARAYATGDRVAFGEAPDLHLAAHEAAHVVQQRAGVSLAGGVGAAGDRYEQNADAAADAIVRGESAERILDPFAGGGGGAVQHAVQRNERRREAALGDTPRRDDPHDIQVQYSADTSTFMDRLAEALGRWIVHRTDRGATGRDLVRNNSNAVSLSRQLEGTADGATISLTAHLIRRDEAGPNQGEVIDIRFHTAGQDRRQAPVELPQPAFAGGANAQNGSAQNGPELGRPRSPQESTEIGDAGTTADTVSGVSGVVGSGLDVAGLGAEVLGLSSTAMTAGLAGIVTHVVSYAATIHAAHEQDVANSRIAGLKFAVEGLGALSEVATYDRDSVSRSQLQRGAPTSYAGYQALQMACLELPDHAIQAEMTNAGNELAREISRDLRERVAEFRRDHADAVDQLPRLRAEYLAALYQQIAPRILTMETPQAQGLRERIERDRRRSEEQGPGPERF